MHSLAGHLIVSFFRRKASGKWQMATHLGKAAIEKRKKTKSLLNIIVHYKRIHIYKICNPPVESGTSQQKKDTPEHRIPERMMTKATVPLSERM